MPAGGLIKDSVALYALQRIARNTERGPRFTPEEEREISRELRAWWMRALGISAVGRLLRAIARAWWRAAKADLQRRAERRLERHYATEEQEPPPPPAEALA